MAEQVYSERTPEYDTYRGSARVETVVIKSYRVNFEGVRDSIIRKAKDEMQNSGYRLIEMKLEVENTVEYWLIPTWTWTLNVIYAPPVGATAFIIPAAIIVAIAWVAILAAIGIVAWVVLTAVKDIIWAPPEVREKYPWASIIIPIGIAVALAGGGIYLLTRFLKRRKEE